MIRWIDGKGYRRGSGPEYEVQILPGEPGTWVAVLQRYPDGEWGALALGPSIFRAVREAIRTVERAWGEAHG